MKVDPEAILEMARAVMNDACLPRASVMIQALNESKEGLTPPDVLLIIAILTASVMDTLDEEDAVLVPGALAKLVEDLRG